MSSIFASISVVAVLNLERTVSRRSSTAAVSSDGASAVEGSKGEAWVGDAAIEVAVMLGNM